VSRQLRDTTAALERNQQERTEEITAAARHLARREAEFGARLTQAAEDHAALERQLTETEAAGQLAEQRAAADRATAAARQKELEDERLTLSGEIGQLRRTLSELRAEHQTVSRVASENVAEVARLGALLTERDVQLRDMVARHQSAQRTAMDAIAQVENKLQMTVEANSRDVAALQSRIQTLERELEVTTSDRDALRPKADRVPHLLTQLDESRAEVRRLFEHSPYGVCRLNRDGSIVRLNRALVRLLAYRTGEELRTVDFATGVFQSPDDLRFLIERSLGTDAKDPVETTWKRKDGRRRIVRVLALAAPGDTVDVIAEDITDLRTTEEKLGQAQRLEAVGRLASEVAVTCNHLLRDVSKDGHQWLDAIGSDSALRRQGELLLGEVTRAASFLRQIAVYGEQQTNALEPVNVTDVLRSLEPVLRRVAGDNIEFVLPKGPRPIPVDVPAERLERILVNVAGYARQRMPHGGKLKIDLTKAIVDRKFLAKYPNVRPGSHALITITEENGKKPAPHWPSGQRADGDNGRTNGEKPGVDVGVLLELVGDCGGHLWMAAEPSGNMVLKIHLPQRVSDGLVDPQTPPGRPVGEPATGRWFNN
jgi:PAS domain S-box-containing protein